MTDLWIGHVQFFTKYARYKGVAGIPFCYYAIYASGFVKFNYFKSKFFLAV